MVNGNSFLARITIGHAMCGIIQLTVFASLNLLLLESPLLYNHLPKMDVTLTYKNVCFIYMLLS